MEAGDYSPGTSSAYRDRLDKQVVPALGALLVGEVTAARVDRLLRATKERHGAAAPNLDTLAAKFAGEQADVLDRQHAFAALIASAAAAMENGWFGWHRAPRVGAKR